MKSLAASFVPGPYDVICGRGKEAKNHTGNRWYTALIKAALESYSKTSTKYEKSLIVSQILDQVRQASSDGGFVKQQQQQQQQRQQHNTDSDHSTDVQWYEVGDHLAREKVGQNLRDRLSNQYNKSSTKAKRQRRAHAAQTNVAEGLIQRNETVTDRLGQLSEDIKGQGGGQAVPEVFMSALFAEANRDMLEAMKNDQTLVSEFRRSEEQAQNSTATSRGSKES